MKKIADILQSGDWKNEKHVPAIIAPESIKKGEAFPVTIHIGEDIPHPNTTEHHIRWIKLLFQPEKGFPYELGDFQFTAHGESVAGADQGPAHTEPKVTTEIKLQVSGTLMALSYCNIHGLWEAYHKIEIN